MIQSTRIPLMAVALLGIVATTNLAWSQQSYDLINDLELLVPASAKSIDAMLEVDIEEIENDEELDRIERVFLAAKMSRGFLSHHKTYFEDLLERELRLLHAVVRLKRSEFDPIHAGFKKEIRKAYLVSVQDVLNRGNANGAGWNHKNLGEDEISETITVLQDDLVRFVALELDAERATRYRDEIKARREFAKEAMIESMVASVSLKFVFSDSQRAQLERHIRDHWKESWRGNAATLINDGVGSIEGFPKQELFELLRETQKVFFDSIKWEPVEAKEFAIRFQSGSRKSALWSLANELEFAAEDEEQR